MPSGSSCPSQACEHLLGRTEGWPAGVYLASLSLSGRADADELVRGSSGTDRFVTSYFWEEVLSQGSERVREFIITVSILDRFCAPLCDAVAETTGPRTILEDLERRNLFLVPLDGERRWFRFHHLFAPVARSELDALHPERVAGLHRAGRELVRRQRPHRRGHRPPARGRPPSRGGPAGPGQLADRSSMPVVHPRCSRGCSPSAGAPTARTRSEEVTRAWMAAIFGDEAALAEHLHALEGVRRPRAAARRVAGRSSPRWHSSVDCSATADRWRCGRRPSEPWSSRRTACSPFYCDGPRRARPRRVRRR